MQLSLLVLVGTKISLVSAAPAINRRVVEHDHNYAQSSDPPPANFEHYMNVELGNTGPEDNDIFLPCVAELDDALKQSSINGNDATIMRNFKKCITRAFPRENTAGIDSIAAFLGETFRMAELEDLGDIALHIDSPDAFAFADHEFSGEDEENPMFPKGDTGYEVYGDKTDAIFGDQYEKLSHNDSTDMKDSDAESSATDEIVEEDKFMKPEQLEVLYSRLFDSMGPLGHEPFI